MADIVVTVPKDLWLEWIAEGDAVDTPYSGEEWGYFCGGGIPNIQPGERVYVVAHGRLRGYAPLTRVNRRPLAFCRRGGAVAVTIPTPIQGFRGWTYRSWDRSIEIPFPRWRTEGVGRPAGRTYETDYRARLWDRYRAEEEHDLLKRQRDHAYVRMLHAGVTGQEVFDYMDRHGGRAMSFHEAADAVIRAKKGDP